MVDIEPLFNQLLIEPAEGEAQSRFAIPDSMKERPKEGKVLAVGPEVKHLHVGNHVFYRRYAGDVVQDEPELILIAEDDVIGRVKT